MRTLLFLSAILFTAAPAFAGNGILELDSKPGGAEVFVDGKKKGTTPETEGQKLSMDLAEGDHVVEVKKEGAGSAKKKIFVGDGVIQPLTLSLAPDAFTNSLSMKFVPVPIKGGKTGGQTILFSVYETRYADFKAFVDATGHDATKESDGKPMTNCWNRPEDLRDHLRTLRNLADRDSRYPDHTRPRLPKTVAPKVKSRRVCRRSFPARQ